MLTEDCPKYTSFIQKAFDADAKLLPSHIWEKSNNYVIAKNMQMVQLHSPQVWD